MIFCTYFFPSLTCCLDLVRVGTLLLDCDTSTLPPSSVFPDDRGVGGGGLATRFTVMMGWFPVNGRLMSSERGVKGRLLL